MNKHLLLILDGYGLAEHPEVSAIHAAKKPYLDHLFATYPWGTLRASERAVGLPVGQMGNSEVGHMNLGAGRVVYQDLVRIDEGLEDGSFYENDVLVAAAHHAKTYGGRLHFMGLFSDGGVHSHNAHLTGLLELAKRQGFTRDEVFVHAFTDGRDTDPQGAGSTYLAAFEKAAAQVGVGRLATLIGRYYAMDRDKRWERTQLAYDLLTQGIGEASYDPAAALAASYANGVTDEFIQPLVFLPEGTLRDNDAVVFYNFRGDRARQITRALKVDDFNGFERAVRPSNLYYCGFAQYDETFGLPVAFPKQNLNQTLGEVIASAGWPQLRAAETEKYPHVTFFFSGGREQPFDGEDRVLMPSPKVATYDLKPEMSALELADAVADQLDQKDYGFVVLNFANPDMVGHTGVFSAAVAAIEAVDEATRRVVSKAKEKGYGISIIADHGNSDFMKNADGSPHTAHTLALVPHLILHPAVTTPPRPGKLGDVAPTILHLLGLPIPAEMTGDVLVD